MRISFSPSDLTGAIDMSSELQATIDFLQNKKGGVISLPAGFIKLNAGVDITKGGITFVGCGWEDYRGYHGQFSARLPHRPPLRPRRAAG